jgi:tRNA nucleotidyltransferase/poly(A) polymerase
MANVRINSLSVGSLPSGKKHPLEFSCMASSHRPCSAHLTPEASATRAFALEVVVKLRAAGYEALWAGGCVRDHLLGLTPKDYDVATSARPEQIRALFGRRRTLEIGAAFGVVTVLGPKGISPVEVATFRCDGAYLDGRRPESVSFSTAELDAQRRDFTINGLFYDPVEQRVIDYVDGQADLQRQLIRAIGDPYQRFEEDKLRMLRAIRFAATFDFALEPATLAAIQQQAGELVVVSAERIAAEMRRMLVHPRRALALELLQAARLLEVVLPEAAAFDAQGAATDPDEARRRWEITLAMLSALHQPSFSTALSVVLRPLAGAEEARAIGRRWKLSNEELEIVGHLLRNEALIRSAPSVPWPQLQRVLVAPWVEDLLTYASATSRVLDRDETGVEFCRQKLALPREELDPLPLLTGDDLKQLGLQPGPHFKRLLDALRDAQLDKLVQTRDEAVAFVRQRSAPSP